ncbi:hypothetical protein AAKU52_002791 [Pedobacter sp. CG_S7]|uniref:hypothetical protein n=1 Tax=Pedobacter sp. CG_S7 TaxID=3143930 RepID=UPI0033953C38
MNRLFLMLILSLGFTAVAQNKKHDPNDQIRSMNWDLIGAVKFELTAKKEVFPIFSETIKRFHNSPFDLVGYLIPIKTGIKQQKFLFATLPIDQCFFCGQNGVPIMILVEMNTPIEYTTKPIRVKGVLKLAKTNAIYQPPISIEHGRLII